jgi:hypothetical protein
MLADLRSLRTNWNWKALHAPDIVREIKRHKRGVLLMLAVGIWWARRFLFFLPPFGAIIK